MTVKSTIDVTYSHLPPEQDVNAFVSACNYTSNIENLKKHQNNILQKFQEEIKSNAQYVQGYNFSEDDYSISFIDDGLSLNIVNPEILYYEYGTETQSPNYILRPAIENMTEDIKDYLVQDTLNEYNRRRGII